MGAGAMTMIDVDIPRLFLTYSAVACIDSFEQPSDVPRRLRKYWVHGLDIEDRQFDEFFCRVKDGLNTMRFCSDDPSLAGKFLD